MEIKTYFFTHDHLNSVNSIINEELEAVQRYNYSVYGETRISDSDGNRLNKFVENRYAYTSREIEIETGDYFYRARYYNPIFSFL